jgi:hypothetical protein
MCKCTDVPAIDGVFFPSYCSSSQSWTVSKYRIKLVSLRRTGRPPHPLRLRSSHPDPEYQLRGHHHHRRHGTRRCSDFDWTRAMTYWPISSPFVFATSKSTKTEPQRVSHDGVEQQGEQRGASHDDSASQTSASDEIEVEELDSARPIERAPSQLPEDDSHGEIIAVRVTRSGHMFATLTRSTLTIWQTKACL